MLKERVDKEFLKRTQEDLNGFFLGTRLGAGCSREVFVYNLDPRWVIKVEDEPMVQNLLEDRLWFAVKGTEWARWFAPVRWRSAGGRVLMMRRTKPLPVGMEPPAMVPDFVADARRWNWGLLGGMPVLHDYGYTMLTELALKRVRLVETGERQGCSLPGSNGKGLQNTKT